MSAPSSSSSSSPFEYIHQDSPTSSSNTIPNNKNNTNVDLQLQFPQFLMSAHAPILAHGGGAEVISPAMFPPPLAFSSPPTVNGATNQAININFPMSIGGVNPALPLHTHASPIGTVSGPTAANPFGDLTCAWFVPQNLESHYSHLQPDKLPVYFPSQNVSSPGLGRDKDEGRDVQFLQKVHVNRDSSTLSQAQAQAQASSSRRRTTTGLPFHFEDDPPVQSQLPPTDLSHAEKSRQLDNQLSSEALVLQRGQSSANANATVSGSSPSSNTNQTPHPYSHSLHVYSGLPVYSQSGFDMLSILGLVASRPNPQINLGPVDLTCSFVVVDVRRYDSPIVYASPTFSTLTGYSEHEILGRNCRFLQSPDGCVERGEDRKYTSSEAVSEMRHGIEKGREFQVSLVNYKKGGRRFLNRVSIVPIPAVGWAKTRMGTGDTGGDKLTEPKESEVAFCVGFQVDLEEQPNSIRQRLRDGKYHFGQFGPSVGAGMGLGLGVTCGYEFNGFGYGGYGYGYTGAMAMSAAERCARSMSMELRRMLEGGSLARSIQAYASSPVSRPPDPADTFLTAPSTCNPTPIDDQLNQLLLTHAPDFVHVLSLKGHFLYVAPAIKDVLGYESDEMVGRLVTEFCHPADCVPVLRELKGATMGGGGAEDTQEKAQKKQRTCDSQDTSTGTGTGTSIRQDDDPSSAMPSLGPTALTSSSSPTVDLLFRIRTKGGTFAWLESVGRLHIEPGKSRKAIVFVGRMRWVPTVRWRGVEIGKVGGGPLDGGGGDDDEGGGPTRLSRKQQVQRQVSLPFQSQKGEFWSILSTDGTFLVASANVKDVLHWGSAEMIGRSMKEFVLTGPSSVSSNGIEGKTSIGMHAKDPRACLLWQQQKQHPAGMDNSEDEFRNFKEALVTVASNCISSKAADLPFSPSSESPISPFSHVSGVPRPGGSVEAISGRVGNNQWGTEMISGTTPDLTRARDAKGKVDANIEEEKTTKVPISVRRRDGKILAMIATLFVSDSREIIDEGSGPESRPGSKIVTKSRIRCPSVVVKFQLASPERAGTSASDVGMMTISGPGSNSINTGLGLRLPGANVFEELEPQRETSWQYELQQLKFANNKLLEEIESVEASIAAARPNNTSNDNRDNSEDGTQLLPDTQRQGGTPQLSPTHPLSSADRQCTSPVSIHPSPSACPRWVGAIVAHDQVIAGSETPNSDGGVNIVTSPSHTLLGKRPWDEGC